MVIVELEPASDNKTKYHTYMLAGLHKFPRPRNIEPTLPCDVPQDNLWDPQNLIN